MIFKATTFFAVTTLVLSSVSIMSTLEKLNDQNPLKILDNTDITMTETKNYNHLTTTKKEEA